jgi:hypothetical protein
MDAKAMMDEGRFEGETKSEHGLPDAHPLTLANRFRLPER